MEETVAISPEVSLTERLTPLILPLAVLTYAAFAMAIGPQTFPGMLVFYAEQARIIPILLALILPAVAIFTRPAAPLLMLRDLLARGGVRLLLVTGFFCVGLSGFTTLKLSIPHVLPFYADVFLADLDAFLHFGDPGLWLHALIPDWAQYPLGYLYGPVWFALWFGLMAFIALHPDPLLRKRYFWSMALTVCLLGSVAATALSSVGPIFYADFIEPTRFAPLMDAIKASAIGDYMQMASGYLLESYQTGNGAAGTGISAMPSMHLAIVTLNACMLTRLNRLVGLFAWLYVALIQIGSVYLGWHYAVDGYFSIAAVSLIWWLCGQIQQSRTQSPALSPTVSA